MKKTNKILTAIVMMIMVITMAQPIEASAASAKPVVKATQTVINKGKKTSLKAIVNGKNVTKKATWKSSNKKVATVNKGVVNAKKAGTTYITATYKNKTSKRVKITVAEMKLNKTSVRLTVGQKYTLRTTYNKKNVKAAYKSSNVNVATVSKSGVVTAKKTGVAYITVRYKDCKATCRITVAEKPHTHNFKPVYKTIHHDEVGHYEEVVIQPAVTEYMQMCNDCGKTFGPTEYGSPDDALDALIIHQLEAVHGGYHSEEITITPAVTEQQYIVDTEAYNETVVDHYECSCGATK